MLLSGLAQVCFTFNPVQEGKYQLPLFLRVKDGKQLQLQLNGRAVLSSAQLSLTTRGSQSCVLAPAPLGELEPPLQCYTLRNGGPAPLQYRRGSHTYIPYFLTCYHLICTFGKDVISPAVLYTKERWPCTFAVQVRVSCIDSDCLTCYQVVCAFGKD